MDTKKRSLGVSPIIATLLLIAITVAAGVIVYVFVSGTVGNLTQGGGQQTSQQIELTSYSFTQLTGTSCTTNGNTNGTTAPPCIIVSIKDAGGSAVTVDSIFFDGQKLIPNAVFAGAPITLDTDGDVTFLIAHSGDLTTSYGGYTGLPLSITAGSTNTLKIVTATGGLFTYTVTAGSSQ
jgi:archaeal type IV pilus assembly protein PilA